MKSSWTQPFSPPSLLISESIRLSNSTSVIPGLTCSRTES